MSIVGSPAPVAGKRGLFCYFFGVWLNMKEGNVVDMNTGDGVVQTLNLLKNVPVREGDIVVLKSNADDYSTHCMTIEKVRNHSVTCIYWRDGLLCRADLAEHCLVIYPTGG